MTEPTFASILLPLTVGSSWLIRAAATPDRFLKRGLGRFLARSHAATPRAAARVVATTAARGPKSSLSVALPLDLAKLLALTGRRVLGDFTPFGPAASGRGNVFASMLRAARRSAVARAKLCAMLAGSIPFGRTRNGTLWLYVLGEPTSPARGVIARLDAAAPGVPQLAFRNLSAFALACALDHVATEEGDAVVADVRARLRSPGIAEQESVRASFERAAALLDALESSDPAVRRAAKKLAARPFEPPHPPGPRPHRTRRARAGDCASTTNLLGPPKVDRITPLALGHLLEAFFREEAPDARAIVAAQERSDDRIVRDAATLLANALDAGLAARTALARDLARRRDVALCSVRTAANHAPSSEDRARLTRTLIAAVDATKSATEPLAVTASREEALLALEELGDRRAVPSLIARAVTGDIGAVDMLGALGDSRAVAPLTGLLQREPQRYRVLEAAAARALATLDATNATPELRLLLAHNPMPTWREGIERGTLVRELVAALGTLRDANAGPHLHAVLDSKSQEYRAIVPSAAWALGRIGYVPALETLERLLTSPKALVTCEAVWAVGEIGAAHPPVRLRAGRLLDGLGHSAPGLEIVRLTALRKLREGTKEAPRASEVRAALERAVWEPAFRQDEGSRRRMWAFRSLEELAAARAIRRAGGFNAYFLGHEAVRYFVTRDDHRVRRAATKAFTAWKIPVPTTRRYYAATLDDLESRGGVDALHEALRDPLGVFRHNVATRLAERAHPSSLRPLAEVTARLFAEPPSSTYEYDDAPRHLVAFVRALARLNRPEGNDVLIDGLRVGHHQVRAVVAENAPDDPRFVPELKKMLGDPRSFLRSRAERSLTALGIVTRGSDPPPRAQPMPL